MDAAVRILLLIGWGLGLLAVVAAPIIAVIVYQNWRRRKSYRRLGEKLGLSINLDSTARLTRATPTAKGKIDGFSVLITATMSADRHYDVSTGTRLKSDLERIVVYGPKHSYGAISVTAPIFAPSADHGFDSAFRIEGDGNGKLNDVLTPAVKEQFLQVRKDLGANFRITIKPDGKILSIAQPPFSIKRRRRIEARLRLMLTVAQTLNDS
jgi:hypothetical protein